MTFPLITAEDAERLNLAVQKKIDPALFLCCNYSPTKSYAYSEDGRFITAVQDLYKFTVDTSCIIKQWYKYVPKVESYRFKRLSALLEDITMLRSVISHNQNEQNGMAEKEYLDKYRVWITRCIGKCEPDEQNDFVKLNRQLANNAKEILSLLDEFVDCMAKSSDKKRIVDLWRSRTFEWYSSNTKTSIYRSFLQQEYISRASKNRINIPKKELNRKVNAWISKAVEQLLSSGSGVLPNKVFFELLKNQLEETYKQLTEERALTTLLPQDFLAEDIRRNFGTVPSPDGDF